ncbi:hypothetical protein ACFOZY_09820 [Chungangia koreensis]|uniref:Uncharacterized protein n=1 Tax=Chungangia koreensis TaxID=752657 RepID=A0ABV8X6X1_9LACT
MIEIKKGGVPLNEGESAFFVIITDCCGFIIDFLYFITDYGWFITDY